MSQTPQVQCPTCGKQGDWFANATGPFCSKRCRLIDLGKWLGEAHTISEPLRPEHLEPIEKTAPGEQVDRPDPNEGE